jgi:hypothetical protein
MPDPTPAAAAPETAPPAPRSWLEALRVYLEPSSLRMLTLGFSAGLPLLLVLGTLSFRLREAGIDRSTIGYLSWVGLAYGFKWVWAPLVDRLPIPLLTRGCWAVGAAGCCCPRWPSSPGWSAWRWPIRARHWGPIVWCALLGGLRLGHAGHCAGRLPHRIGQPRPPGRAGGVLSDRLPPGHDLGRRRRAVDRGARRGGARRGRPVAGGRRPTRTAPGRRRTW